MPSIACCIDKNRARNAGIEVGRTLGSKPYTLVFHFAYLQTL